MRGRRSHARRRRGGDAKPAVRDETSRHAFELKAKARPVTGAVAAPLEFTAKHTAVHTARLRSQLVDAVPMAASVACLPVARCARRANSCNRSPRVIQSQNN